MAEALRELMSQFRMDNSSEPNPIARKTMEIFPSNRKIAPVNRKEQMVVTINKVDQENPINSSSFIGIEFFKVQTNCKNSAGQAKLD